MVYLICLSNRDLFHQGDEGNALLAKFEAATISDKAKVQPLMSAIEGWSLKTDLLMYHRHQQEVYPSTLRPGSRHLLYPAPIVQ